MNNTHRWLSRLSFSFIIIAAVLLWTAYKRVQGGVPVTDWRILLYVIAAMFALALGGAGVRARHRDPDRPSDGE